VAEATNLIILSNSNINVSMPFTWVNIASLNVEIFGVKWNSISTRSWIAVLFAFSAILLINYARSPWRKLPPGPTGIPLLGNVLQLLVESPWLKLTKWKDTYGENLSVL
jgi:hypothetical protein